ncbi:hypothetical protein SLS56_001678 [Neofusicoccum ribis]|uniref:Uncharacterized protein n=1 Tax=Neofusicoccum ribis TaxID=45134 RepID=A0ABR3T7W4_9PEZI
MTDESDESSIITTPKHWYTGKFTEADLQEAFDSFSSEVSILPDKLYDTADVENGSARYPNVELPAPLTIHRPPPTTVDDMANDQQKGIVHV